MTMRIAAATLGLGLALAATGASATGYSYTTVATGATTGIQHLSFVNLDIPAINNAGTVVFDGAYVCTQRNDECQGLWMAPAGGSPVRIASGNIPNVYPTRNFASPEINDAGTISVEIKTYPAPPPAGDQDAIYEVVGSVPKRITPVEPGYFYVDPQILSNDAVVFQSGQNDDVVLGQKLWTIAPNYCGSGTNSSPGSNVAFSGSLRVLGECEGDTAIYTVDLNTKTSNERVKNYAEYGAVAIPTVNNNDTLIFSGSGIPNRTGNVNALFAQTSTGVTTELAEIDNGSCASPSSGCQWMDYNTLAVNDPGAVAAEVVIFNTAYFGTTENFGVTLNGDAVNGQVAWPGMTINDCPILDANSGPRAINNAGQIVFVAYCMTTTAQWQEIIVATPQP